MADVQEPPAGGAEPSMEEILASIRKIITDESPAPAEGEAPPVAEATGPQDVIELTQLVQDDGSIIDLAAAEEPPPSLPPPVQAAPPIVQPAPPPPPEPVMTKRAEPPLPPPSDTLVSESAAAASMTALSSLASTVEIERLASAPTTATPFGNGARTLEDMVIELMRPLLKQWLDQNLPATVDRLVQKEIERISRKATD